MPSDTYDAILWVARRLFIQRGYASTSMREIAEEIGIGKATIYHHFLDKQSIMAALLEEIIPTPSTPENNSDREVNPHQQIRKVLEANMAFFKENGDIIQIISREIPDLRPRLLTLFTQSQQQFSQELVESIRLGIEQKVFRPVEPDKAVQVLSVMVQGSFSNILLFKDQPLPGQNEIEALLDIFFQGINA